ncbi:transmembrane protein, putative [Bodo saltans]|uniref:Transmembrane protein, putative n=1 Tax=Bodo saltans TaxID=75058 RepID=A0A0S4JRQ1_BODSA|nr:transmembrane protein, putative [Bodo saltans]|eukprot:CUG92882.1 transmembrane protein, putative [Bodo saltans]
MVWHFSFLFAGIIVLFFSTLGFRFFPQIVGFLSFCLFPSLLWNCCVVWVQRLLLRAATICRRCCVCAVGMDSDNCVRVFCEHRLTLPL